MKEAKIADLLIQAERLVNMLELVDAEPYERRINHMEERLISELSIRTQLLLKLELADVMSHAVGDWLHSSEDTHPGLAAAWLAYSKYEVKK